LNVISYTNAQNKPAARDTLDWKTYYSSSTVDMDSINYNTLRGNWVANSTTTIGDYVIGCSSHYKNSGILEIKGNKYRNTLSGEFNIFYIDKNMIVFNERNCSDTAYINLLSEKQLTICFKRDRNYIQYHYRK
jgi:hypothetical protein